MSLTDHLAGDAEQDRAARERRTAVAHALRDLTRNGSAAAPHSVAERLTARRDGTSITADPDRPNLATRAGTNHADWITHASRSVETDD